LTVVTERIEKTKGKVGVIYPVVRESPQQPSLNSTRTLRLALSQSIYAQNDPMTPITGEITTPEWTQ